jgi:hypothetical protein
VTHVITVLLVKAALIDGVPELTKIEILGVELKIVDNFGGRG